MNYPPALFYDENFSKVFNSYTNQNSNTLIPYQTLAKKLLKFENKDHNFQNSVLNWIKYLPYNKLVKYFSFKSQWFIDILQELILISTSRPETKYQFKQCQNVENSENKEEEKKIPDNSYITFLLGNSKNYNPKFTHYFSQIDYGVINLSKSKKPEDIIKKQFMKSIRYVTLNTNNSNNNNQQITDEKEEKAFYEYNNVVTLSHDLLSNVSKLIDYFATISNGESFKYPIEIESYINKNCRKYYYNFKLPKWLPENFTLPQLLCCYFEQCLLVNYQYYLLYKEEISFIYYDKFDELLENITKLVEFIGNANEKKVEIFQNSLNKDETRKKIKDNKRMKDIVNPKRARLDDIRSSVLECYSIGKRLTTKSIVDNQFLTLQKLFINGDFNFVYYLTFIDNDTVFTENDFVLKIAYDDLNNYYKNKVAEDLLHELTTETFSENTHKKRKKKKKKNKNNNVGNNSENEHVNNENVNQGNNNNNEKETNNENKDIKNNNEKKNEKENINIENENSNEKIEKLKTENKNIDTKENIEKIEEIKEEPKEELKEVINEEKNTINNSNENNKENITNEIINDNENNTETQSQTNSEPISGKEIKEKDNINITNPENQTENENKNTHKKKKEKNFFLYPVINSTNKKKKNKQQNKEKTPENNNKQETEITEQKDSKKDEVIETPPTNNNKIEIIETEDMNNTDYIIKSKNNYDYKSNQKNKFNIGIRNNNRNEHNSNMIIHKNRHNHHNNMQNNYYQNNNQIQMSLPENFTIEQIAEGGGSKYEYINSGGNNYFMKGSNSPRFTSMNFNSRKKTRGYRNNKHGIDSVLSLDNDYITEFDNEILENTKKVNKNKIILQNIREKYKNKILNLINDILKNNNIEFLSAFYGSTISGLAVENSDIDIMIKLKKNYSNDNSNYISKIINIIVDGITSQKINFIIKINPISTASVPVIKLECDLTNELSIEEISKISNENDINFEYIQKLFFDITFFEVENIENKIPSELIVDYIKECIITYPNIIDIVYIMKRYLCNKKLNKSYQGGISSYSLFLLILAFVKFYKKIREVSIGSLLIKFLYHYANTDFGNTIIQPKNDNEFLFNVSIRNDNICIIDPITGNNVAKSTYKIEEIKNCFSEGNKIIFWNLSKANGDENNNCNSITRNKKTLEIFLGK